MQVSELRADTVKAKGGLAWLMPSENCKRGLPAEKRDANFQKSVNLERLSAAVYLS